IFKQMGCVPRTIRIDNMTTAVIKPKSKFEDATLTNEFLQFAMHYGFNVQTCNPASGHEKGSVENKVGYVRYNFFSETPKMKNFSSLNKDLEKRMLDRKSTRLNSSHVSISYAVFCLKKKKTIIMTLNN